MALEKKQAAVKRQVRTAPVKRSIWRQIPEDTFRRNIVGLAKATNGIPSNPIPAQVAVKSAADGLSSSPVDGRNVLSIDLESRLANDFAFLAANAEGVGSVAAACLEQDREQNTLTLRLAANEGVPVEVRTRLIAVWETACSTSKGCSIRAAREKVFDCILHVSAERIRSRMRLAAGKPPSFLPTASSSERAGEALTRAIRKLEPEARIETAKKLIRQLLDVVIALIEALEQDAVGHVGHVGHVGLSAMSDRAFVKQCYNATTANGKMLFKDALLQSGMTPEAWLNNKEVMQIEKIGAYWRIARTLAQAFRREEHLSRMSKLNVQLITPFEPVVSHISSKVSKNGRVDCFVHAEVQLIVHYIESREHQPRVMGTSKSACFLCRLFLEAYGQVEVPASHGRLYDQWTIPDLANFDQDQSQVLRNIVQSMHRRILAFLRSPIRGRAFPQTSRQDLVKLPASSVGASSTSTMRPPGRQSGVSLATSAMSNSLRVAPLSDSIMGTDAVVGDFNGMLAAGRTIGDETGNIPPIVPAAVSILDQASIGKWRTLVEEPILMKTLADGALELFVEIESPASGRCRELEALAAGDSVQHLHTVDVETISYSVDTLIEKHEADRSLSLCFRQTESTHAVLELEWRQ